MHDFWLNKYCVISFLRRYVTCYLAGLSCLINVIYDGYNNTYSLNHNGKSLTLAPLLAPKPYKAKLGKGSEKSSH